jgi:hypothetical protein
MFGRKARLTPPKNVLLYKCCCCSTEVSSNRWFDPFPCPNQCGGIMKYDLLEVVTSKNSFKMLALPERS